MVVFKAFQLLVELAIKKSSTSAEKLLCMAKSYEYRYREVSILSTPFFKWIYRKPMKYIEIDSRFQPIIGTGYKNK
jgi:hypothetical protein